MYGQRQTNSGEIFFHFLLLHPAFLGREFAAGVAKEGNINLLKWAKENGCPLEISTFVGAVEGGCIEMLEWLREEGCP